FVMGTSEFMLAGLLPAIATELDVSVGTAGLLTSAFAVGTVVGGCCCKVGAVGRRRGIIRSMGIFSGRQFPREIILWAVRWYCR
ncbi:Cmx/CmrA family chloramphenicol efflux MFS transporter, partial [Corynebacterium macclintockiae]